MAPQTLLRFAAFLLSATAAAQTDTWPSLMTEGHDLLTRGKYFEARERYLVALRQAEPSGDVTRLAASLTALGAAEHDLARFAEAERLHRRALAAAGRDPQLTPVILSNLASSLLQQADTVQARQIYQQAHDYWKSQRGKHDAEAAIALGDIASTYETEGQFERASALYARALKQLERLAGVGAPVTFKTLNGYAATVAALKDYKRAERLWRYLISRYEHTLGPKHPDTIGAVISLAVLFAAQNKDECIGLYERAISDGTDTLGLPHAAVVVAIAGLSSCLSSVGRHPAAIEAATRALLVCQAHGCPAFVRAAALTNLAMAHAGRARHSEAAAFYAQALTICAESTCGPLIMQKLLPAYAASMRKLGRKDEAASLEARAESAATALRVGRALVDVRDLQPAVP